MMTNLENDYLQLLKWTLTDYHRVDKGEYKPLYRNSKAFKEFILISIDKVLRKRNLVLCKRVLSTNENRLNGNDWPSYSETMIGLKRLNNIEECLKDIIKNNVEGDCIETGVWRGGATIFMKAVLKVLNETKKIVWVADSFEGLPKPDDKFPEDKGDRHYEKNELSISLEDVKNNFKKYGLLDERVKFLKGWFKDTLPVAPIERLSLLRLDGDMYQSTIEALESLYPKLSVGGYIIIDDWGAVEGCKKAVEAYRKSHQINEEIKTIDWAGVYWKKTVQ